MTVTEELPVGELETDCVFVDFIVGVETVEAELVIETERVTVGDGLIDTDVDSERVANGVLELDALKDGE